MLEELKERVYRANIELVNKGIVIYTWGNVSGRDRETGYCVIKPSGVPYDQMCPEDMVVVDIMDGKKIEGKHNPSVDTMTHIMLYRRFQQIGGIAHTHSINAVSFAQAGKSIPALGTTHADYFYGDIPCTRELSEAEVSVDYEENTGKVIIEHILKAGYDPADIPGILVRNHGPFSWGKDADAAVYHAVVMEAVAEMAIKSVMLNPASEMPQYVLDKHYERKHGKNAYYGQKGI